MTHPEDGTLRTLPCRPELNAWGALVMQQDTVCTETVTDNAVSNSCEPIPGKYSLSFAVDGTPEAVAIKVEHDGAVLVNEDFSPSYKESRPNGKGCGPVCKQAAIDVTVP